MEDFLTCSSENGLVTGESSQRLHRPTILILPQVKRLHNKNPSGGQLFADAIKASIHSLSGMETLQCGSMHTPACDAVFDACANEKRLAVLHQYRVLDTPPETAYDDIAQLAAFICGTPMATVTFVDKERQWYKSEIGLGVKETPADVSICAHALLHKDVLVVPDTLEDERFRNNPYVTGQPGIRFYAGSPLISPGGFVLGTLCVLDYVPKTLSEKQMEALRTLARQVMTLLELRRLVTEKDVTLEQQRKLEVAVRRSEERFRFTTEATGITLFNQDRDLRYTWVDNVIPGSSSSDVIGKTDLQLLNNIEDLSQLVQAKRHVLKMGEGTRLELVDLRPDGTRQYHEVVLEPIRDEAGDVVGLMGASTNITERKLAEQQLAQAKQEADAANRAKDRFFAVLSHELRAPLHPALMIAASLAGDEQMPERFREDIQLVHRNIELEANLIDSMLDLTRIANGKLELHVQRLDLEQILSDCVAMCRSEAAAKSIELVLECGAAHHGVSGDSPKLQQVFGNIVRNAIKFTPRGGRVEVRSSIGADGKLRVEVADTGVGIDPEVLPKVFEAFEQGRSAVTREFGGLGLGLAICKGIVGAHGGKISAASAGKGKGTTMTVELPVSEAAPVEAKMAAPQEMAGPGSLKILLVEDHEDTLRAMARLLRKLEHSVITATCVVDALDAADKNEFDLVISDLGLPDGTGLELMRSMLEKRPCKGIALTGYGMESDIDSTRLAGFNAHLTKPVNFQALASAIQRVSR
jgi:PAS domain S-box-containing protein